MFLARDIILSKLSCDIAPKSQGRLTNKTIAENNNKQNISTAMAYVLHMLTNIFSLNCAKILDGVNNGSSDLKARALDKRKLNIWDRHARQ